MLTYVIVFAAGWAFGHFGYPVISAMASKLFAKFKGAKPVQADPFAPPPPVTAEPPVDPTPPPVYVPPPSSGEPPTGMP